MLKPTRDDILAAKARAEQAWPVAVEGEISDMVDTRPCRGPDGRTSQRLVLERPLPGLAVISTPAGDSFSLTHEGSGLALGFFRTQMEAKDAARFCETVDWTVSRELMGQVHRDAFAQVQWSAAMYQWERVGDRSGDALTGKEEK